MGALAVKEDLNVFLNLLQILSIFELPILVWIMASYHNQCGREAQGGDIRGIRPKHISSGMVPIGTHGQKRLPMSIEIIQIHDGIPHKSQLRRRPLFSAKEWFQQHMTHYYHTANRLLFRCPRRDPAAHMVNYVRACAVAH